MRYKVLKRGQSKKAVGLKKKGQSNFFYVFFSNFSRG
jgi:hypothetical protein